MNGATQRTSFCSGGKSICLSAMSSQLLSA
jgi:hypothetical protein